MHCSGPHDGLHAADDKQDIQQTVLRLKERVGPNGIIFSSGGIGPTHDDVTYESLAAAFGMPSPFVQAA